MLRDLNFLEELENHCFAPELKTLLGAVFDLKKQQISKKTPYQIDAPEAILLEKKLNKLLAITIDAKKYPKTDIFQRSMIKYRGYLLPCAYDLAIAPNNNASERAIRTIKLNHYGLQIHRFCLRLKSVTSTIS